MSGQNPKAIPPTHVTAVADSGATAKVIITTGPVNTQTANDTVTVYGFLEHTVGTAGTVDVLKFVRGEMTGGTEVGVSTSTTVAAAGKYSIPFMFTDTPGLVAGLVYSVVLSTTSASADGTVNSAVTSGIVN